MIEMDPTQLDGEIAALIQRYADLPKAVARTHAAASMKRAAKDGIPVLRRNTPPSSGGRRGRRRKGEKRSTGLLRRAVTSKGKYVSGRNPRAYAVLGYRGGDQSRKAIWLEFGTRNGVKAFGMAERTLAEYGGPAAAKAARELAIGLERAAKDKRMEIAAKKIAGAR